MKDKEFKDIRAFHSWRWDFITDFLIIIPTFYFWAKKTTDGLSMHFLGDRKQIEEDIKHGAFFMSNHRDIVMDAAWLVYLLRTHYNMRPFIGVGDNLFAKKWIEWLMKYLRCFAVKRGGGLHAQLDNSKHLSAYIRMLRENGKSIWLAQREGRAKDSNDLTQPSVLHMLELAFEESPDARFKDFFDYIKMLNICPVCISYEYDPCDYLKAAELQLKRDNPKWRKTKQDDVLSMRTGIRGYKGKVVYRFTPSINHDIDEMLAKFPYYRELPVKDQIQQLCNIIDRHIHQAYEIYERGTKFDEYIESRIAMIDIPNKDEAFLREKLYEMYNNPVINHQKAIKTYE